LCDEQEDSINIYINYHGELSKTKIMEVIQMNHD